MRRGAIKESLQTIMDRSAVLWGDLRFGAESKAGDPYSPEARGQMARLAAMDRCLELVGFQVTEGTFKPGTRPPETPSPTTHKPVLSARVTPPQSKQALERQNSPVGRSAAPQIDPEDRAALLEEADRMLDEYNRISPCSRADCSRDAIFHGVLCRAHALEEAGGPQAVPGGNTEIGELFAVVSHLTGRFTERLRTVGEFDPLSSHPICEARGPSGTVYLSIQVPSELPWQKLQLSLDVLGTLLADEPPFMGMELWEPGVEAGRARLFLELLAPARITFLQSLHTGLWGLANSVTRELLGEQGAAEVQCDAY